MVFGKEEIDDASVLPGIFISVYQTPFRTLGLENSADVGLIRDAFRKASLCLIKEFSGLHAPKHTYPQVLLAYHLCRKTLTGPATKLKKLLHTSPYLVDAHENDILPVLRPIKSKHLDGPTEYRGFRGFRQLAIVCVESILSVTAGVIFKFDVHYCMRRYLVEYEYEKFLALHNELSEELLVVPALPVRDALYRVGITDRNEIGSELAKYMMRIHRTLANKGLFSPRLLQFLKIPYQQVQSEEEGHIVQILDTPNLSATSVWHIVDEAWLSKWRTFVLGRDARRYTPPGKISNDSLVQVVDDGNGKNRLVPKAGLKVVLHYRVVNYDVWRFYEIVHGGGPVISRQTEDIYAPKKFSRNQAAIFIQSWIRCCLAYNQKDKLYTSSLSCSPVALSVMTKASNDRRTGNVDKLISRVGDDRKKEKLVEAVKFTQTKWRHKKRYIPEENLERRKRDQEVFARAKVTKRQEGLVDEATQGDGLVVTSVHPIIHIGNTGILHYRLSDEEGLPFRLDRLPGSEIAVIKKVEKVTSNKFIPGSKILSINYLPTASLTYDEVKDRFKTATYPLNLEVSRPPNMKLLTDIVFKRLEDASTSFTMSSDEDLVRRQFSDDSLGSSNSRLLQQRSNLNQSPLPAAKSFILDKSLEGCVQYEVWYQSFKILLSSGPDNGFKLRKYSNKLLGSGGVHETQLYISDTMIFFKRKRDDIPWVSLSLYKLRHIKTGDKSAALVSKFRKFNKSSNLDSFFELATDTRSYLFEVTGFEEYVKDAEGDGVSLGITRTTAQTSKIFHGTKDISKRLVQGLEAVIKEAQQSRWYVDKYGIPKRRLEARTSLMKVERGST